MCLLEKEEIARAILGYLARNPEAQDTLPGIVEWWLLDHQIRTRTVEVKEAIDQLVADRLILKHKGIDAETHYRINPRQYGRVEELIKKSINSQSNSSQ
jgi:hypothetical protein